MTRDELLGRLLHSSEPSIRWKARLGVLEEDPASPSMRSLREEVRSAPRSRELLREPTHRRNRSGPPGVYHKWQGVHWALAALVDLGYPPNDPTVDASIRRALELWLRPTYFQEFDARTEREASDFSRGVPRLRGRYRRCASQQGNALLYTTVLGGPREAAERLVERLCHWQWPDGGWNCDRTPSADTSSFAETLTPLIGLTEYARAYRSPTARDAAERAAEVFLRRRLFRRVSDGRIIHPDFVRLHYPLYWHYDVLGGLKAMARLGRLADPRCTEALDVLESKELANGGWAAGSRFFDTGRERPRRGTDRVRWGATGRAMNEWVSVDALAVLRAAGRYTPGASRKLGPPPGSFTTSSRALIAGPALARTGSPCSRSQTWR